MTSESNGDKIGCALVLSELELSTRGESGGESGGESRGNQRGGSWPGLLPLRSGRPGA
jgi:hypothetical protein